VRQRQARPRISIISHLFRTPTSKRCISPTKYNPTFFSWHTLHDYNSDSLLMRRGGVVYRSTFSTGIARLLVSGVASASAAALYWSDIHITDLNLLPLISAPGPMLPSMHLFCSLHGWNQYIWAPSNIAHNEEGVLAGVNTPHDRGQWEWMSTLSTAPRPTAWALHSRWLEVVQALDEVWLCPRDKSE